MLAINLVGSEKAVEIEEGVSMLEGMEIRRKSQKSWRRQKKSRKNTKSLRNCLKFLKKSRLRLAELVKDTIHSEDSRVCVHYLALGHARLQVSETK